MSYLEKLLKASNDMIAKDKEIAALLAIIAEYRVTVGLQDKRIAALEGAARRSKLPFKRDQTTPALLRPQAG
jgi:hypothetical protein